MTNRKAGPPKTTVNVRMLLEQAGVDPAQIKTILANPSHVEMIRSDATGRYVQALAQQFPATAVSVYDEAVAALGFTAPDFTGLTPDAAQAIGAQKRTAPSGAIQYPGGVTVDPVNQQVYFPPTDRTIQGSPAWMAEVATWDKTKVTEWRERLAKAGYIDSKKGGVDVEFMDALNQYHQFRFLYGGGKPIDLKSPDGKKVTKKSFGGVLDKDVLATEVRTWFQQAYGDDPTDDEMEFFTDRLAESAVKIARRRDLSPGQAAGVAQAKVQEEFIKDPETQAFLEQEEDEEEYGELANSILSLAQITSA